MNFSEKDALAACRKYGPLLKVEFPLKSYEVMLAIGAVESGGGMLAAIGHDCGPRHEPAYDSGGHVWQNSLEQQKLVGQYGSAAACSYGPWQVMFINCPGFTPSELETDLEANARCFVAYFNSYVIKARGAKTLVEIGQVYNGGHIFKDGIPPGVQRYVDQLSHAYVNACLADSEGN